MKALITAALLAASVSANAAEVFRPWGDPVTQGPTVTGAQVTGKEAHYIGFQPFAKSKRTIMDRNVSQDPRVADSFRMGIGFQPRSVQS